MFKVPVPFLRSSHIYLGGSNLTSCAITDNVYSDIVSALSPLVVKISPEVESILKFVSPSPVDQVNENTMLSGLLSLSVADTYKQNCLKMFTKIFTIFNKTLYFPFSWNVI